MPQYDLYWFDGTQSTIEGNTLAEAFYEAGFTANDAERLVDEVEVELCQQ